MREKFEQALLELGANPANKGFTYTVTALELIDNDRSNLDKITALYSTVAKSHANANGMRVERAIRHMVEQITNNTDIKIVAKYFNDFTRMTNSKFLVALHLAVSNKREFQVSVESNTCSICSSSNDLISVRGQSICKKCVLEAVDIIFNN